MYKRLIQIVLVFCLLIVLSLTFYNYFYEKELKIEKIIETQEEITQEKITQEKINTIQEKKDNVIYNLSYKKFDIQNNFYQIEASEGVLKENDPNLILMKKVKATIRYLDYENLIILSENAIFNNKSFETNFYNGVRLIYEDQNLSSDNLDFLFDKNIAIFKDNVRYENLDTKMFSDQIILNLFTKEIVIKAKKDLEKIKILKN